MDKSSFKSLFKKNIEIAIVNAEQILGKSISTNIEFEMHGADHSGTIMDINSAVDILYLSAENFYRIIDISVIGIGKNKTRIFVHVSGLPPSGFDETWNTPYGNGPFKQLLAKNIQDLEV